MMDVAKHPSVLLGITTRNRAQLLFRALESALAQDYPAIHVVVVDDASTDETPDLRARFPLIEWIRRDSIRGYMANRNDLMRRADFDYFVSLDDDAWFLRGDEVSLAVARLQDQPRLAAVAFDILSPARPEPAARGAPRDARMFIGCGHALRLSAVREAGGYTPSPGAYGSEEKDLSLRLADLDYRIERLPGVHVWHEQAWQDRDWSPLHRSSVCNELVMTLRRCPMPDLLLVLPLKVMSFAWYWLRRPALLRPGLGGLREAARAVPRTLATRQPVRRSTFWEFRRPI